MAPTIATIMEAHEDPLLWLVAMVVLLGVALALWHAGSIGLRRLARLALAAALVATAGVAVLAWSWSQRDPGNPKEDWYMVMHTLSAVQSFYANTGRYPPPERGWLPLIEPPDGLKPWLEIEPKDRFGRVLHYALRDGRPCVVALGPDGALGTADDVTYTPCRPPPPDAGSTPRD